MNRRAFLRKSAGTALAGSAAAVIPLLLPAAALAQQQKPNVLFFTVDDLGTKLGCYNHAQVISPNIDAFATESVLFERCYCQSALCAPSRTSILTGVRPSTSGLYGLKDDWKAMMPDVLSIPEHFQANGYYTQSLGKIWDGRSGYGNTLGWDKREEPSGITESSGIIAALRNDCANNPKPFFFAVGLKQPHCPFSPTAESLARYTVENIQLEGPGRSFHNTGTQNCLGASSNPVSDDEAKEITMNYFASVTDIDTIFGEVLGELKTLGLYDNTIVIFWCADHGFSLGENNRWGKWTNYDVVTRVPLVMRVPGAAGNGKRASGLVECVDMYQTLLELCGLPKPPHTMDGLSFAPLLENPSRAWKKAAFSQWAGPDDVSVKTAQYDLIVRYGEKELYDLVNDPKETTNIAATNPQALAQMEALLAGGWQNAFPDENATRHRIIRFRQPGLDVRIVSGNTLHVTSASRAPVSLELCTLRGRIVRRWSLGRRMNASFDIKDIAAGVYSIAVNEGHRTATKTISLPY